jgi:soluble lytic murein transglycosylase
MRTSFLVFLLAAAIIPLAVVGSPRDGTPGQEADLVDSARAELGIGRYWHAAQILEPLRESGGLDAGGLLLLAEAEAGYRNWPAVRSVLEGRDWLDDERGGEGWRLLGRALEEEGALPEAAAAYARYEASAAGAEAPDREAVRARRTRILAASRGPGAALPVLDSVPEASLRSWLALDLATAWAEDGDTSSVRQSSEVIAVPAARRSAWEVLPRARLMAGDSAGAEVEYRLALDSAAGDARMRTRAWTVIGSLRLSTGDTASARDAFLQALEMDVGSASFAAARLLELGIDDQNRALEVATALSRSSQVRPALEAYDLAVSLSRTTLPVETRLARARLLSLAADREDEALSEFRALADLIEDRDLGVRNLTLWEDLRRRQGRSGDVATIRGWIVDRYPESPEAVGIVFLRGDASHDRGALDEALGYYEELQRMNSSLDQSGLARMRMGQIHLRRGDRDSALAVYRAYLDEFPDGRRWAEATYWIGRVLLESGDTAGAEPVLRGISEKDPLSYYAVEAAGLLGEVYRLPALSPDDPPTDAPGWLVEGLRALDWLRVAGLTRGYDSQVDELRRLGGGAPDGVLFALARGLLERGLTIEAINLGWELRERGHVWSRGLLEIIYPFPYREMVVRAAAEEGLEPIVVAALTRQESAFDADIVSPAGAVGLMQVMPATGRDLSRTHGPADFSVASLEAPEVNLHLGVRFLRAMWDRYDGSLPLVLSAYNAGPTRANAWRNFPEAADPVLFTDRIPFRETRDYVKLVTRNVALYRALYGDE